jgi:hypothetical protein
MIPTHTLDVVNHKLIGFEIVLGVKSVIVVEKRKPHTTIGGVVTINRFLWIVGSVEL